MTAAPKASKRTARQIAAAKNNLIRARAVARTRKRTARQIAAARQNLVKARAAQASRRKGKKFVKAKKAKAPAPASLVLSGSRPSGVSVSWISFASRLPEAPGLHEHPACAAVALAESILVQHGAVIPDAAILELHALAGDADLSTVLEAAAGHGLGGWRLAWAQRADPGLLLPGMVYGITLRGGYHAVCAADVPTGRKIAVLSWGLLLPLAGEPEEAWLTGWEDPDGREI